MHGDQRGNAHAFGEQLAHAMAGGLGRDHRHIDVGRRIDLPEVNVEAVREHQRLAGGQMRRDVALIQVALHVIGNQHHHDVGCLGGIGRRQHAQPGRFGLGAALARFRQAHHDLQAGIAQIQRMRVPLAAVADNPDGLTFEEADIAVLFVVTLRHLFKNSV